MIELMRSKTSWVEVSQKMNQTEEECKALWRWIRVEISRKLKENAAKAPNQGGGSLTLANAIKILDESLNPLASENITAAPVMSHHKWTEEMVSVLCCKLVSLCFTSLSSVHLGLAAVGCA